VPFLAEPEQRTQFDLSWRMFGIRVRVHPLFWLVACILGGPWLEGRWGAGYLLLWVACVFVSILVHELGHVLAGRAFGAPGHILLYSFGGLAIGSTDLRSRWKRVAVTFAGPLAGLILFGIVYLTRALIFTPEIARLPWLPALLHPDDQAIFQYWIDPLSSAKQVLLLATGMLLWMNLGWSLLNLLPIYPLDGGQISMELFSAASARNGPRLALGLSLALAALIAVNCILAANGRALLPWLPLGGTYTAILFGMLAVENLMMLQQLSARQRRPWDEGHSGW
jgi:stage IV sporulation protein FB